MLTIVYPIDVEDEIVPELLSGCETYDDLKLESLSHNPEFLIMDMLDINVDTELHVK